LYGLQASRPLDAGATVQNFARKKGYHIQKT